MSDLEYGLLGEKLGHSFSPAIHKKLAGYDYRLVEKKPEELADFLTHGTFKGLNVTIPYKKAVIPFCQTLTDQARRIGSVRIEEPAWLRTDEALNTPEQLAAATDALLIRLRGQRRRSLRRRLRQLLH